ncbi:MULTISPECIES: AAA family ATPase [unclassified Arthrobacter]|uniref:AAA family ATPase n=1 Tax=unclassified Arthrobacter TaxID=235627 RepID=UPI0014918EE0|nr:MULTISPECIES: P-loop NTPase [unclassified Arthrobacter]MBE0008680.1 chromosome partitioning protein [Arthrobacter sp. AET 35A]NOJ62513.1 P-loop NTPase [Arthrobacter sp. 147(2020)]
MSIPVVTCGLTARECVTGLEKLRGPVTVVRWCADLAEVIAVCQTGLARAVILSTDAGELTASLIERFRNAEVAVVALATTESDQHRLDSLGVAHTEADVGAAALAAIVEAAVKLAAEAPSPGIDSVSYADPAAALGRPATGPPLSGSESAQTEVGEVMAVWGPAGSPGRTTVAVNLAAELAAGGRAVLLIDADTYGASVAASLGLLDESAGLAQACRLADQGSLDLMGLNRAITRLAVRGSHLGVLTGITRADRWTELRPAALTKVLELSRLIADVTIVDCGFCLETDEELSFDTVAPRRNAATLCCLGAADTVIAVGAADAVGLPRLIRALADLEAMVPTATPRVVLNKVRAAAVGRGPERQLREAWDRFGPSRPVDAFLPADFSAVDSALLGGSVLLESAPRSPLRTAIAELAGVPIEQLRRSRVGAGHNEVKFSRNGVRLLGKGPQRSGL